MMLCGQLFVEGGCDMINCNVAAQSHGYFEYGLLPLHSVLEIQHARPGIINVPLMLIFRE
jgi:hypothetical protein